MFIGSGSLDSRSSLRGSLARELSGSKIMRDLTNAGMGCCVWSLGTRQHLSTAAIPETPIPASVIGDTGNLHLREKWGCQNENL